MSPETITFYKDGPAQDLAAEKKDRNKVIVLPSYCVEGEGKVYTTPGPQQPYPAREESVINYQPPLALARKRKAETVVTEMLHERETKKQVNMTGHYQQGSSSSLLPPDPDPTYTYTQFLQLQDYQYRSMMSAFGLPLPPPAAQTLGHVPPNHPIMNIGGGGKESLPDQDQDCQRRGQKRPLPMPLSINKNIIHLVHLNVNNPEAEAPVQNILPSPAPPAAWTNFNWGKWSIQ
jgi:hypothetical protein